MNAPPSPAQLAMKQKMENMRREHTAALKHEGTEYENGVVKINYEFYSTEITTCTCTLYVQQHTWFFILF